MYVALIEFWILCLRDTNNEFMPFIVVSLTKPEKKTERNKGNKKSDISG